MSCLQLVTQGVQYNEQRAVMLLLPLLELVTTYSRMVYLLLTFVIAIIKRESISDFDNYHCMACKMILMESAFISSHSLSIWQALMSK